MIAERKKHTTIRKVAIFSGNGALPKSLMTTFKNEQIPYHVIAFQGVTESSSVRDEDHTYVGMGEVSRVLEILKAQDISHIVMAGSLRRPSISEIKVDAVGAKWLARLGLSMFQGDDGLLKKLISLLEEEGYIVLGPHEVLGSITLQAGFHTALTPNEDAYRDMKRGLRVLRALDQEDVGQAVVIQQGLVLGVEAVEGTQALLQRVKEMKRPGFGGVLVKIAKVSQTHKADLPTIGLDTVTQVQEAGLAGIVVSAETTQILQKDEVLGALNAAKLFLVALSLDQINEYIVVP